jgi:rSAM/selenodomain-associated transferase 2
VSVSVIIPFVDEEKALPATLAALCTQAEACEIIAVDGGSRDGSRAIVERHPALRVIHAPRGRATQMNAGAHLASGTMLLFLHADTLLPDGAIAALERLARRGPAWGGFRHLFSNADWRLRSISHIHNLRCRVTKVFYGDQAMFVTRDLFHRAGGFPVRLMEDIALSRRLKALCQPVLLPQVVVADSRKFVRMGVWRSLARVALILGCDNLGLPYPRAFFEDVR